jgi:hypothetical protein
MVELYNKIKTGIDKLAGSYYGTEIGDGHDIDSSYKGTNEITSASASNIIAYARSFIGKIKYSQGKRDAINNGGGFADCSSFVHHVFSKFGINLGTYTGEIVRDGKEVSYNQLQPGDLVMFKNTCSTNNYRGVTHVGIYTGNGNFIHCSSSKNSVVETTLNSNYWQQHWLCGRRVISDTGSGKRSMIDIIGKGSEITYKPSKAMATISKVFSGAKASNITKNTKIPEEITNEIEATPKNNSSKTNTITIDNGATNKLLGVMITLLSKMVDNTSNIDDIVKLLTKVLEKSDREITNSTGTKTDKSTSSAKGSNATSSNITKSALSVLNKHTKSDSVNLQSLILDLQGIVSD